MLFHSLLFIYLFLPLTLFFFYISRNNLRNIVLLIASLVFSGWFQIYLSFVLVGSIVLNYFAGIAIERAKDDKRKQLLFILTVVFNILLLGVFKYLSFLGGNLSDLISVLGFDPFVVKEFGMPLGISFYTFKALTYIISVKRGEVPAQRNFVDLAVYIAIFPQLIAGPIDRYRDLAPQLNAPATSFDRFSSGVKRFSLGLAKKMLLATPLAIVADKIFESPVSQLNAPLAWLGAVCYMLQIYYDFAGYTDMAIGTGKMFGLEFTENFNFPYTARSVRDFWKRWHISLSTWLRDYLFLPLAYARSKRMVKEEYLHLKTDHWVYMYATIITFLLCGFWHGAAWTFIVWGLLHGVAMVIEQFGFGKILKRSFLPLQHFYLLFFLTLSWVFFRAESLTDAFNYLGVMFGGGMRGEDFLLASEYLDFRTLTVLLVATAGATRLFDYLLRAFRSMGESSNAFIRITGVHLYYFAGIVFVIVTIVLTTIFILAGTSTPFIYFKF